MSVDDFGTGHSALAYLKELPVDELKIDRTFVAGIGSSPTDAAICGTVVVARAPASELRVVAEGVASDADVAALRRLGCDAAQGFHLGRPVPAALLGAVADRVDRREPPRDVSVISTHR